MSNKNILEQVTIRIPVIDLAHVLPTIQGLANIRTQLPVSDLLLEVTVDPTKFPSTDPNDPAAVQKVIDSATARLKQSSQSLKSVIDSTPKGTL